MAGNQPVVIKKVKKVVGGGHHGGAWKVAYADFVTAMMAFFLLMWLINTTSPEQKRGIADYFAPASVSKSTQGSDGMLGGTAFQDDGARSGGSSRPSPPQQMDSEETNETTRTKNKNGGDTGQTKAEITEDALNKAIANRERAEFERAEQSLRQAMEDLPDLAELSKHLIIDQTPEGLRIQLVDQEGRAMFAAASPTPLPRTERLLQAVSQIIQKLPNRISISGHTDTQPGPDPNYSNWELSSDRANAARRILRETGVEPGRIFQVSGKASSEPLFPDDPDLPGNRRISIVLLREAPVLPSDHSL
ncbi:MAG: flagellar motor protein MotB [Pseudomonadota bacterium]